MSIAAAAGVGLVVRSILYGVQPLDPVTFVGVPAVLLAVALTASLVPAVRATRIEAVEALRDE